MTIRANQPDATGARAAIRTAHDEARDEVRRIAHAHKVAYRDVMGDVRMKSVVKARWAAFRYLVETRGWSAARAGRFMGKDHTTVLNALGRLKRGRKQ